MKKEKLNFDLFINNNPDDILRALISDPDKREWACYCQSADLLKELIILLKKFCLENNYKIDLDFNPKKMKTH